MDVAATTDKVSTWAVGKPGVTSNISLEYKLKRAKRYNTASLIIDLTNAVAPNSLKWNFKQIGSNSADKF